MSWVLNFTFVSILWYWRLASKPLFFLQNILKIFFKLNILFVFFIVQTQLLWCSVFSTLVLRCPVQQFLREKASNLNTSLSELTWMHHEIHSPVCIRNSHKHILSYSALQKIPPPTISLDLLHYNLCLFFNLDWFNLGE